MKKIQKATSNSKLLENIEIIVRTTIREEVDDIVEKKLNDKLKNFPTKEEFFDNTDKIMGELKAIREDNEILNGRTSDHANQLESHEQRISKLEQPQILPA